MKETPSPLTSWGTESVDSEAGCQAGGPPSGGPSVPPSLATPRGSARRGQEGSRKSP